MEHTRRSAGYRDFFVFLCATFLVRAFHVLQWPQIVWGMNHVTAASAKDILTEGLGDAFLQVPALPPLLVSATAAVFGVSAGDTIIPLTLLVGLLYASAFWLWIDSLNVPSRIMRFSALAFVFLPYHNSYTSLGSLQTTIACTLAVLFAALINRYLREHKRRELVIALGIAATLPWVRSEYCLLIPLYLLMVLTANWLITRNRSIRQVAPVLGGVILAIAVGVFSAISLRASLWEQTNLVPSHYSCWTFLDGMPSTWLEPEDDTSEFNRRLVGIEHFGHPADFGYSLRRMVMNSPGKTLSKFVLSIPRWLNQIGHRDQVTPLPASMLAILGLLFLVRCGWRRRRLLLAAQALALVLVTTPVIAVMLYAEYLGPAFSAEVLLMAYGALAVVTIGKRYWRAFPAKAAYLVLAILLCVGMQYLYFRSGSNLPDRPYYRVLGQAIERMELPQGTLIEPYSGVVDANCRSPFLNHSMERRYFDKHGFGRLPPAPLDVWETAQDIDRKSVQSVIVWSESESSPEFKIRIQRWINSGFQSSRTHKIDDGTGKTLFAVVCAR